MAALIDFFNARKVQEHFSAAGTAAACGDNFGAAMEIAKGTGWILLAASAGWTGGGGAAAKGVKLKDLGWYELGSQTINGNVYKTVAHMDKVSLGKHLVQEYGWRAAIFKRGPLKPKWKDLWTTLKQGPTPGGYVGLQTVKVGAEKLTK